MTVRFLLPDGRSVEYAFRDGTEPRERETIILDGTDPDAAGVFAVYQRTTVVGLRGASRVDLVLGLGLGPTV